MITSWHCNYSVPLSFANIAPAVSEPFAYSEADCTVTGTSSPATTIAATSTACGLSSSTPCYSISHDSGDILFALAMIFLVLIPAAIGFLFSAGKPKRIKI